MYERELKEYEAKIAANPLWAKKVNQLVEARNKKRAAPSTLKKGPALNKRQRNNSDDDDDDLRDASLSDNDDDDDKYSDQDDSEYGGEVHKKKGKGLRLKKGLREDSVSPDGNKLKKRDIHGMDDQDQESDQIDDKDLMGQDLYYFQVDEKKMDEHEVETIRKKQR